MATVQFDRDSMANWYASQHLQTDPGVRQICYLPAGSPDREIRFIEVNILLGEMTDDALEPVDFGVDTGEETAHKLYVLDVTPAQWEAIQQGRLAPLKGWSLDGARILGTQNP